MSSSEFFCVCWFTRKDTKGYNSDTRTEPLRCFFQWKTTIFLGTLLCCLSQRGVWAEIGNVNCNDWGLSDTRSADEVSDQASNQTNIVRNAINVLLNQTSGRVLTEGCPGQDPCDHFMGGCCYLWDTEKNSVICMCDYLVGGYGCSQERSGWCWVLMDLDGGSCMEHCINGREDGYDGYESFIKDCGSSSNSVFSSSGSMMSSNSFGESMESSSADSMYNSAELSRSSSNSMATEECFHGNTQMLAQTGNVAAKDVAVGDKVAVMKPDMTVGFETVFLTSHADESVNAEFVVMETASGKQLTVTRGHKVVTGSGTKAAGDLTHDDTVLSYGQTGLSDDKITAISSIRDMGIYNPKTTSGTILANGVVASTYTTVSQEVGAHLMLWPVRQAYQYLPNMAATVQDGRPTWLSAILTSKA